MTKRYRKKPQNCTKCTLPSIHGLLPGHGKCPFHWAAGIWGIEHASRHYPEHIEALKVGHNELFSGIWMVKS